MMESDKYKTIKSGSQGMYKEKGSRFIAFAFPLPDQDMVSPILDRIRKEHHEARHHCYAYIIGNERTNWRASDDGEPSGTAGKPILGQINSYGLTDILIVVCRYFGGILLGTGGLINAYRSAAASALENAVIIERTRQAIYEINYPYNAMNDVMRIIKEEDIIKTDQSFDIECRIRLHFDMSSEQRILGRFSRIEGLEYRFIGTF
jgi:uncharacterized YigZ family protein